MATIGMATQPTNGRKLGEMQQNNTDLSVHTVIMKMQFEVAA